METLLPKEQEETVEFCVSLPYKDSFPILYHNVLTNPNILEETRDETSERSIDKWDEFISRNGSKSADEEETNRREERSERMREVARLREKKRRRTRL